MSNKILLDIQGSQAYKETIWKIGFQTPIDVFRKFLKNLKNLIVIYQDFIEQVIY